MSKDSTFLGDLLDSVGNEYGSVVDDGLACGDVKYYIDTGSYILNALISGSIYKGIPGNKTIGLAGVEAVGKTYMALSILKQFLQDNPTGCGVIWDSECAYTSDMFIERGIDPKRVLVLPVDTVQKFQHQFIKVLDRHLSTPEAERRPMLPILDSLGMLSTTKEMTDSAEGKEVQDMTRAKQIKAAFRTIMLRMGLAGIPLLMTNHGYFTQEMYPRFVPSGGQGLAYAASILVVLSKRKEKDGDEVIGNIIKAVQSKGRFTKSDCKCEMLLDFSTGLNRYYGLLEIAEKYGIFKKVSTRYEMPDGTKVFGKQINENPEKYYTKEILDQIDAACRKEFCYGSALTSSESSPTITVQDTGAKSDEEAES